MVRNGTNTTANPAHTGRRKKKLRADLALYFPKRFGGSGRNQAEQLRQYLILQLQYAINPDDAFIAQQFKDAYTMVVGQNKPLCLRPEKSELVAMELGWTRLCITLAECDCPDPKSLTVFEMYAWIDRLEEKFKPQTPVTNAGKRK